MLFRDLDTRRLRLKNIAEDDRDFLLSHFSDRAVHRFLFAREPLSSLRDAEEIIRFYLQPEPRGQHRWILIRKEDGAKIGTCGFHCWHPAEARCEMGYDLRQEARGKGYMAEALRGILLFARDEMMVRQLDACIYPENEGSVRLAEGLGFVFSGKTTTELSSGEAYEHRIYTLNPGSEDKPAL